MLAAVSFWHWLALGAALIAIEMAAPGFYLLWFGVAALLTGLVLLLFPDLAWFGQGLAFVAFAIVAVAAARWWAGRHKIESDQPALNRRGEQYIGQLVTLETALANGRGRARVGDTIWPVAGPDLPAGAKVRVVGVEGVTLRVERAERV